MVKLLRALSVLVFFTVSSALCAQVNEVSLVSSGEGPTENEAINAALRSAIEQAYGVFVSANTDILNDELVKDEIVTVSSGNIHSYKNLGCVTLADGSKSVSVEATVSVSNLVKFAQSKGASCEFAGALFGANLKLINLNKENAEKAVEHLYKSLEAVAATMYDYEVLVGQPTADGKVSITAIAKANDNYKAFADMTYNTLKSLNVKNVEQLKEMSITYFTSTLAYPAVPSIDNIDSRGEKVKVDIGRKWKLKDRIATLFDVETAVKKINRIQNEAAIGFVLKDSNDKAYNYPVGTFRENMDYSYKSDNNECHSIIIEPDYMKNVPDNMWYEYKSWAVQIFNRGSYFGGGMAGKFSWVETDYLIFVPNLKPGAIAAQYQLFFKIPVEELMTISGFTIERKVK